MAVHRGLGRDLVRERRLLRLKHGVVVIELASGSLASELVELSGEYGFDRERGLEHTEKGRGLPGCSRGGDQRGWRGARRMGRRTCCWMNCDWNCWTCCRI